MRYFLLLSGAVLAGASTGANAQSFQNLDAVDAAANAVVESGLTVRAADRRMKLTACPEALRAEMQMRDAVAVRCATAGWRIRLPIEGTVLGDNFSPVVIRRGDPVTIDYETPTFSVTANGIADNEARRDEPVRVRMERNSNPVTGEATGAGTVRIRRFKD